MSKTRWYCETCGVEMTQADAERHVDQTDHAVLVADRERRATTTTPTSEGGRDG